MKHYFTRIIKARAYPGADADYFTSTEDLYSGEMEQMKEAGWVNIEVKHISNRDPKVVSALNKCSLGSKNERKNLQILFNEN